MRTVVCVDGERFEIYSFYDPADRESECRVVIGGSVERHRRIPIDESDVECAARKSGLGVIEHFAPKVGIQHFYVLRKTPSPF
jgi:hypothetical protein